uniref:DUF4590 domain-containing protein n=1 Tax=Cynoglossus semilaevis TaxID=244447 RepID=A0A3P8V7E5_CYNSE
MDSYQKESMRRIRRNSLSLLQDFLSRGAHRDRDTPIPAQPGRDAKMLQSVASVIKGKNKLLLLENPDTVEIYKLNGPTHHSTRTSNDDLYLPIVTTKASNLTSIKGSLSQSCPYLCDRRRGSFSSVASQRTGGHAKKQTNLVAQREAKKSNVAVTMTYLGQGHQGSVSRSTRDELKVLQQVNGGENICVFKGLVKPGEQFQFISQRHRGYPFSATLYVNGIMVGRISSCCEYRYAPGFQQGKKSCFRLMWQAGGLPCYRCTSLRNKFGSCQSLNNIARKNFTLPLEPSTVNGTAESCPSSPLFVPAKPRKKSVRRMINHIREGGGSTDSEELALAGVKETTKKKRRKSQTNRAERKGKTVGQKEGAEVQNQVAEVTQRSTTTENCDDEASTVREEQKTARNGPALQTEQLRSKKGKNLESPKVEKTLPKQQQSEHRPNVKNRDGERPKDLNEECVEKSVSLEHSPTQHKRSKAKIVEVNQLQRGPSSCPRAPGSVELSSESEEPEAQEELDANEKPDKEQDLQAQLDAMMTVLSTCDEVEHLVLRNTDLTDDHLLNLAGALKKSSSEVTMLNLNLNLIGPYGAHILLDVLRVKPQVKGLHLFGNKLRDHGVQTLLNGIAELQEQTAATAASIQQAMFLPTDQNMILPAEQDMLLQIPAEWSSFRVFVLLELDIGGNGLGSEGVKLLASYVRYHSYLQYLGLAQTSAADLGAWKEFFDSLKCNTSLAQINLDENNLGDPGVRLLADMLRENMSLQQVDLDRNGISDVGGNDIMGALLCRAQLPLRHLSLEENNISAGLMSRIQEEVKFK